MEITIIKEPVKKSVLAEIARSVFGDMAKAVVDIEKGIMAVGGELHSDAEIALVEREGSVRQNTWGINLYPGKSQEEWIEFDSMINLKPSFGNRSRDIENAEIKEKIRYIINKLIIE